MLAVEKFVNDKEVTNFWVVTSLCASDSTQVVTQNGQ